PGSLVGRTVALGGDLLPGPADELLARVRRLAEGPGKGGHVGPQARELPVADLAVGEGGDGQGLHHGQALVIGEVLGRRGSLGREGPAQTFEQAQVSPLSDLYITPTCGPGRPGPAPARLHSRG